MAVQQTATLTSISASNRGLGHRRMLLSLMVVIFLLWIALPLLFPPLAYPIYWLTAPLRYLGVFVHEMGHGLASVLSGGRFYWFQMDEHGGAAVTSGGVESLVLLGGLLGPALFGSILLMVSTRAEKLRLPYLILLLFFACGAYYMLKPVFMSSRDYPLLGQWHFLHLLALVLPLTLMVATVYLLRTRDAWQRLVLQCLGIVLCYSAFSDTSYIFRYEVLHNGAYSDARVLAALWSPFSVQNLPWLVFAVCAALIAVLNFALLGLGVLRALRQPR